ncbi:hypothetical protein OOJ91_12125 [Micromonospora lupini]|uniref:hypothetical protein n=1 Tax=Micromonospora lupini TaxID=285679 RepID=UPI002259A709|nr:hypothetical protein [Micromonospora lupini]MCX5066625.1 hypothetical protein [Micromonospora lupini]
MTNQQTKVHADLETTAVHSQRRAWEAGAIVSRPGQEDTEHHWIVDVRDLDLHNADPVSLDIGGFWQRHPQASLVDGEHGGPIRLRVGEWAPHPDVVRESVMLRGVADLVRDKAVICGSNPAFDQYTLEPRMLVHGIAPGWYYHPCDVPERAKGWLAAQGLPAPDRTDDVVRACGLDPAWYARHTAVGDCRLFRDLYRIVTRPPKRPPGGFWPVGGRPARRRRTCAGCGDDIWPNELVYPADASGDTSDTAGVQCAVCESQSIQAGMGL